MENIDVLSLILGGLAYGMILFIISVGLSVTMGLMGFVNLAHGAFAMIGGYVAVSLMTGAGLPFLAALACAGVVGAIIGAAIAVHRELGPGFLESVYENALAIELHERAIHFQRQIAVPVLYRGAEVGLHRLDLFVDDRIVVELKATRNISGVHFHVVRSYLSAVHRMHGLILNFAHRTLEVKRVLAD